MIWEQIDEYHQRASVFGGWLVKAFENVMHLAPSGREVGFDWRMSMCFVPDPKHQWKL